MSNPFRAVLQLESLDARITPSSVDAGPRGFTGLAVAARCVATGFLGAI